MGVVTGALFLAVALASSSAPNIPWGVFAFILSSAAGIFAFWTKRQSADRAEVAELRVRLAVMRERMKHFPCASEVSELSACLRENTVVVKQLTDKFEQLSKRQDLVESFLIEETPTR